jgi:hypothetical protein
MKQVTAVFQLPYSISNHWRRFKLRWLSADWKSAE